MYFMRKSTSLPSSRITKLYFKICSKIAVVSDLLTSSNWCSITFVFCQLMNVPVILNLCIRSVKDRHRFYQQNAICKTNQLINVGELTIVLL